MFPSYAHIDEQIGEGGEPNFGLQAHFEVPSAEPGGHGVFLLLRLPLLVRRPELPVRDLAFENGIVTILVFSHSGDESLLKAAAASTSRATKLSNLSNRRTTQ